MSRIHTSLPLLAILALTAGCAGTGEIGAGTGLSKSLSEMQLQYPGLTQDSFASFDADGNGLLDSTEQQAVFQAATSPDGIGGATGALDMNTN